MSDTADTAAEPGDDKLADATRAEEAEEARAPHTADRLPTPDEEAAAEGNELDPDVTAHEKEMGRIGADVKGEGEID